MSLQNIQDYFYKLCFDKNFSLNPESLYQLLPADSAQHILSQNEERRGIYRKLVYNNISDVVQTALPIFFHFLGEANSQELIRNFLADYKPRANLYRLLPQDFLAYLKSSDFHNHQKYPFLLQLADYEFCDYHLLSQKGSQDIFENNPDISLENAKLIINPNLYLRDYDYDLTCLSEESDPEKVEKQKTHLIIFRNLSDHKIHFFKLSALSHSFLEIFLNDPQTSFLEGLEELCTIHSQSDPQSIMSDSLSFLKELLEKQIVLALT